MKTIIFAFIVAVLLSVGIASAQTEGSSAYLNVTLLNQNPDPVGSGDIVELRFIVENPVGSKVSNVQFELILEYPFTAVPGETYRRTVTTIDRYQVGSDAVILKYKVRVDKDAVKGVNGIKLKQTYQDSGFSGTDSFLVDITGTEFAQIIYVDKAKIDPGKETELKFTITNVGNSPLKNLVFSWSEENGILLPVYSDDTKYINNIDVGESVELVYTVVADVNANPGLYQLDLSLKYESSSGTQQMNTKAGIFIGGETDFDVTFSESSEGQTSLSVANTGNNPALSVTVRIPDQQNFRVSGTKSSIIGNLDKGDYTIVSFQIVQNLQGTSGMPFRQQNATITNDLNNENLKVQVEYTDTTGVRHVVDKYVAIQFRDITTSATTGTTQTSAISARFGARSNPWAAYTNYIILIVAVVVLLVLYKKRSFVKQHLKRKKKKV